MHVWNKNQLFKMSLDIELKYLYTKIFVYNCIPTKANVLINLK